MDVCPQCGATTAQNARYCGACGQPLAGGTAPSRGGADPSPSVPPAAALPLQQFLSRRGKTALLSLGGLLLFALLGDRTLGLPVRTSLGTLVLLAIEGWLMYYFRRELIAGLQVVERWPALKPWWDLQRQIPKELRWVVGIGVSFMFAYMITPFFSSLFNGFGFLVFSCVVILNIIVAHLLLRQAPEQRP